MGSERSSFVEQLIILAIIAAFCGLAFRPDGLPSWMLMREIPLLGLSLLGALAVHELAHAAVAMLLGDPTPRLEGRLTFNPLAHLHPLGTLLILLVGVGWARPVSIDSTFFRNERRGIAITAAAGPLANLLVAAVLLAIARMLPYSMYTIARGLGLACLANAIVFAFNLIPIPPLDGHNVLRAMLPERLPRALGPVGSLCAFTLFAAVLLSMMDNSAGRVAACAVWAAAIVSPIILAVALAVRLIIEGWRLIASLRSRHTLVGSSHSVSIPLSGKTNY